MLVFILFLFIFSPTFTAVVPEKFCNPDEYVCSDLTCISGNSLCDGRSDCWDGSDETACDGLSNPLSDLILNRSKRQAENCRKNQWQCRDGTCIGFDGKCDGIVDCPDFSDETFALCRTMQCQSNWFRCTYGACVDGTAPCNGVQDCADDSDELLPRCRNTTTDIRGKFTCTNGQVISSVDICDGKKDCADGSDETLAVCAGNSCPSYVFQCAYGACVDRGSMCNKVVECADGSDESDELCNKSGQSETPATTKRPIQGGNCVLPPYPQYGSYKVRQYPTAVPGQRYPNVRLDVTCNPGFQVDKNNTIFCDNGEWSAPMPSCLRFCRLNRHPSVEYRCLLSGNSVTGSRECGGLEPSGTIASPVCRSPNYYTSGVMSNMHCVEGSWDYIAICKPGLTNITIVIDKVEIMITSDNAHVVVNNYGNKDVSVVNHFGNVNSIVFGDRTTSSPSSPNTPSATSTTSRATSVHDNEINEVDWRMAAVKPVGFQVEPVRPKNTYKNDDPKIYYHYE